MRFADGPEDDGGRFNGAGTPRPAFNHSILHQLSMLYDSIAASMPFSACFDHFSVKPTQVIVHELFTRKKEALQIKLIPNRRGTPQGGVISPLLANLCLNPLDHGVNEKTSGQARMVRYADDLWTLGTAGHGGVEGGPMNEFGEPNMGNPSVRFDEGRSGRAGLTTAVSSKPPPATSPTLLLLRNLKIHDSIESGATHEIREIRETSRPFPRTLSRISCISWLKKVLGRGFG